MKKNTNIDKISLTNERRCHCAGMNNLNYTFRTVRVRGHRSQSATVVHCIDHKHRIYIYSIEHDDKILIKLFLLLAQSERIGVYCLVFASVGGMKRSTSEQLSSLLVFRLNLPYGTRLWEPLSVRHLLLATTMPSVCVTAVTVRHSIYKPFHCPLQGLLQRRCTSSRS